MIYLAGIECQASRSLGIAQFEIGAKKRGQTHQCPVEDFGKRLNCNACKEIRAKTISNDLKISAT